MIKSKFFIVLIIFTSFISCNKEEINGYNYWGSASGLQNNNNWNPKVLARTNKPYRIGIDVWLDTYNSNNIQIEHLSFFKIPFKVGRYPLSHTKTRDYDGFTGVYYGRILGGDALGAFYELVLNDSIDDYIEITKIDGIELSGIFNASFKRIEINGDSNSTEFSFFTEGKFFTRLQE